MSSTATSLPPGFQALEPFVSAWAINGAHNRLLARLISDASDRVAFFNATQELLAPALDYLDSKPLEGFSEQDQRLMLLLLSMAHISLAVEIQGDQESVHAEGARHMTITRAAADS
jgi:hypothetical protein